MPQVGGTERSFEGAGFDKQSSGKRGKEGEILLKQKET